MTGAFARASMACLGFICLNLAGCATLQFPWEKPEPHASARNPVVQIVCLWEASSGKDPEGKACRGFAGQVIFLGNKGGTPVAVDGLVRIKEYDQFSGPADENEPFHQFDFPGKAWDIHKQVGSLGPTYHCFIPYMRKGNHDASCEIVVEYTPEKGGPMVTSTVTPILLKGKASAKEVAAARANEGLIPHTPAVSNERGRITTIPLDGRQPSETGTTEDAMAARLARMERVMQDFAAQQTANNHRPAPVEAAPEPVAAGQRFSMNGRRTTNMDILQTAAAQVAADETESRAAAPTSQRHVLSAHPLALEENLSPANREQAVAQRPSRRHPLADEPAFATNKVPQHRNTPPATLVVPEELSDAPAWDRAEENTTGRATVGDELDGKTTQVP